MESRTQFLEAAAALHAKQYPETAASLKLHLYDLRDSGQIRYDETKTNACPACGSVQIPGDNQHLSLESSRTPENDSRSKKPARNTPTQTHLISTCVSCGRFSRQQVHKKRREKKSMGASEVQQSLIKAGGQDSTSTAGKRKRRKKAPGLQDLLAKAEKAGKTSQPGLDLMDLMQM